MEEPTPAAEPHVELVEDPPPPKPPGFWKRQFSEKITTRQKIFDILFGAIVPVLLLIFDPIIFSANGCVGYYAWLAAFAYFSVGLGIIALLIWLFAGARLGVWSGVMAGSLIVGGLFATGVGIIMLPYSVLGLFFCIGVLGFIPFLTSFVYFRNGVRAYRQAKLQPLERGARFGLMLTGILIVLGIPGLIQMRVSAVVNRDARTIAANRSAGEVEVAVANLKLARNLCLTLCEPNISAALVIASPTAPAERERMAKVDRDVTGAPTRFGCLAGIPTGNAGD